MASIATFTRVRTSLLAMAAAVVAGCPPGGDRGDDLDDGGAPADAATFDDATTDAGPRICRAPCEGDTHCVDGFCRGREAGFFDPGCATNLTIGIYPCTHLYSGSPFVQATVCNRGSTTMAAPQLVRFESEGATFCETTTPTPIDPGRCMAVTCTLEDTLDRVVSGDLVRATVNPDGTTPECGDALDNTMESEIAIGCE